MPKTRSVLRVSSYPEVITMAECDGASCAYTLDSIEPASTPGTRIAHLVCTVCDARLARLTQRSDAEIQAELDAMDGS